MIDMKRFALTLAALLLITSSGSAFDWKSEPNDQLRGEMIEFARDFSKQAKGTKAGRKVRRFVRKQERLAAKDQYAWIPQTHALVDKLEKIYGPARSDYAPKNRRDKKNAEIRKNILKLLDYPLHVDNRSAYADPEMVEVFDKATEEYLAGGRGAALKWLEGKAPEPGKLEICKVYNMGYFLRTSERTFAIDIRWDGTEREAQKIAKKIDVIFLTHPHGDHFCETMLNAVVDEGKPIILPSDVLPAYQGGSKIIITDDIISPINIAGINIQVLRGDQGENVPNNIYILDFDGWRVVHQGDNARHEIEAKLSEMTAPDIVIAACWNKTHSILSALKAAQGADQRPLLYIPGHENEMQHTVDHRESYWELFNRADRLADPNFNYPPYVLIDHGESISLTK